MNMAELIDAVCAGNREWRIDGRTRVQGTEHPSAPLVILNYTHAAQYANEWTWVESVSRGLIVNTETRAIHARAFDKFHNWRPGIAGDIREVTEKMDGVLGIGYRWGGEWYVATRGCFESRFTRWATNELRSHDMTAWPADLTPIFELVAPISRIVVDYGPREELVLIGARNHVTGADLWLSELRDLAHTSGFSLPAFYEYSDAQHIADITRRLGPNREGFVLRMADGQRWKMKGEAYRRAHRFLTDFTPKVVLRSMLNGTLQEEVAGVDEKYLARVYEMRDVIEEYVARCVADAYAAYERLPHSTRKELAVAAQQQLTPRMLKFVMAVHEGQDVRDAVWRGLHIGGWKKIRHLF